MILVNEISAAESKLDSGEVPSTAISEIFRSLTLLLAPFAPFLSAELWEELGGQGTVFRNPWPVADADLARESEIEIPVQINGKLAAVITVSADADDEAIKSAALASEKIVSRISGKTIVKIIVVKGKLVNLVVK